MLVLAGDSCASSYPYSMQFWRDLPAVAVCYAAMLLLAGTVLVAALLLVVSMLVIAAASCHAAS